MDYDIGVIKVSEMFVYSFRVQPILVPPAGENFLNFSRNATVSGWGSKKPDGWLSARHLQSINIPLVQRSKCRDIYLGSSEAPKITSRMLCAAGTGLGGPCHVRIHHFCYPTKACAH